VKRAKNSAREVSGVDPINYSMSANRQSAEMSRLEEAGSRGEKRRVEQNYHLDWIEIAIFGLSRGSEVKRNNH
jgi:hypothetical protein